MRSSNPVLGRLGQAATAERASQRLSYAPADSGYGISPVLDPRLASRPMTLDDVVVRTVSLVALVVITAGASWLLLRSGAATGLAIAGASIGGLVLVLVISFRRITNPALICLYAALQGVVLGVVSRAFEHAYPGIVVQAVGATLAVFFGMAALYKIKAIRATPRFTRWVIGALIGVVGLSLLNWVLALFGKNLGLVYYSPTEKPGTLAIVFSLVCIGIGALTFILDFDAVEQGLRYGLPERYAWYCAFGLVVGLIYLYWQILRLLGYMRR